MSVRRSNNPRTKIDDVARKAGVSTATVSRVINGTGTVSASTQEKVYEAIRDLRFVAHGSARGLAGGKTKTIGLVMPALTTFFFTALVQGINEAIEANGYSLLVYSSNTPASVTGGKPLPLADHNTDGVIVFTDFLDDYSIQFMYEQDFPVVMLHRTPPEGLDIPVVTFENMQGAMDAVNHLIDNGRRRIAFLKGPEGNEDSRQREIGYKKALELAGIDIEESLIHRGSFATGPAFRTVNKMFQDGVHFDAIFAGDDNAALGAMDAVRANGKNVPADIAIVGFNDDFMAQYVTPPLTTVKAPIYRSGQVAGQKILNLIEGKDVEFKTRLRTELVIRSSSGGSNG